MYLRLSELSRRRGDALAIHVHALHRETRDVVDRDVVQLGVGRPVLVEDQEQLLRSTQREYGQQDSAATLHNTLHQRCDVRQSRFPLKLSTNR